MIECMMMPAAEALGAGMPSSPAASTAKKSKMSFSIDSLISAPERPSPTPLSCNSLDLRVKSRTCSDRQSPPPVPVKANSPPASLLDREATTPDSLQQRLSQERRLHERLFHRDSGLPFAAGTLPSVLTSTSSPTAAAAPVSLATPLALPFAAPFGTLPGIGGYVDKLAQLRGDLAAVRHLPLPLHPPPAAAPGVTLAQHPMHNAAMAAAAATEMPLYPWLMSRHGRVFPGRFAPGPHLPEFLFQPFRKPKRIRTAFSPSQLLKLEHAFEKNHYVVGQERKQLAQSLNLSETQVKVWFQNRRTKHKRSATDGEGGASGADGDGNDVIDDDLKSESDEDETSSEGIDVTV